VPRAGAHCPPRRPARSGARRPSRPPARSQYNHHFTGFFYGNQSGVGGNQDNAKRAHAKFVASGGPQSAERASALLRTIMFSEGNGNEHRRTLRALSRGFAYLLHSPVLWDNSPMVINTNKRLTGETSPGPIAALLPRRAKAPRGAGATYSGLIECPCTDRKDRRFHSYELHEGARDGAACRGGGEAVVESSSECVHAAQRLAAQRRSRLAAVNASAIAVVADPALPRGCLVDLERRLLSFNTGASVADEPSPSATASSDGLSRRQPSQVCRNVKDNRGTIDGNAFRSLCAEAPRSQLLTGTPNAVCNLSRYVGGDLCCRAGSLLLDSDQRVPAARDKYRLRYRFFFEEYSGQRNALYAWWSTSATSPEYDVPASPAACSEAATPHAACVHELRSRCNGRDLLTKFSHDLERDVARDGGWFELIYAAPHCHTPACELMELWDDDRGELICRGVPVYGDGSGTAHAELGYIVSIPPCLWGTREEGLHPPPRLHLDSNLSAYMRSNATRGHPGSMALWQMRVARLAVGDRTGSSERGAKRVAPRAVGAVDKFVVHR
jgi:hypothetical protein